MKEKRKNKLKSSVIAPTLATGALLFIFFLYIWNGEDGLANTDPLNGLFGVYGPAQPHHNVSVKTRLITLTLAVLISYVVLRAVYRRASR